MFWKEFIPRKIGFRPSIKVREAFPEDKACQQCDCRDSPRSPLTGPNAGPRRLEDNRRDHAWTNLLPQPSAARKPCAPSRRHSPELGSAQHLALGPSPALSCREGVAAVPSLLVTRSQALLSPPRHAGGRARAATAGSGRARGARVLIAQVLLVVGALRSEENPTLVSTLY